MQVPLEYDLLKEMAPTLLRNRLVLLHHFSDIFCPGIAAFPLGLQVRALRALCMRLTVTLCLLRTYSGFESGKDNAAPRVAAGL